MLALQFTDEERINLANDPTSTITTLTGLTVIIKPRDNFDESSCSIEGLYLEDTQRIEISDSASQRRTKFTALHELGHHLVRSNLESAKVLASAHKIKPSYSQRIEERIVDAFAAEILVPRADAESVLGGRTPTAPDVVALYEMTHGSREACCVRIAQYMRKDGYVILAQGRTVLFCVATGDAYAVRRGTTQDVGHLLDRAFQNGLARDDQVRMRHSTDLQSPEYGGEALVANGFTFAILTSATELPWGGHRAKGDAKPRGFKMDCMRCGFDEETWKRCPKCYGPSCPKCHWCHCDEVRQARMIEKRCIDCRLRWPASHYGPGSDRCRDCV